MHSFSLSFTLKRRRNFGRCDRATASFKVQLVRERGQFSATPARAWITAPSSDFMELFIATDFHYATQSSVPLLAIPCGHATDCHYSAVCCACFLLECTPTPPTPPHHRRFLRSCVLPTLQLQLLMAPVILPKVIAQMALILLEWNFTEVTILNKSLITKAGYLTLRKARFVNMNFLALWTKLLKETKTLRRVCTDFPEGKTN